MKGNFSLLNSLMLHLHVLFIVLIEKDAATNVTIGGSIFSVGCCSQPQNCGLMNCPYAHSVNRQ